MLLVSRRLSAIFEVSVPQTVPAGTGDGQADGVAGAYINSNSGVRVLSTLHVRWLSVRVPYVAPSP